MNTKTPTFRKLASASALCATIALAGCTMEERALEHEYVANSGAEQYPIEVVKGPVTLNVANKGASLTPSQINAISSFARKAGSGTPVTVSRPSGASSRLSHEVANLVSQQGVPAHMVKMSYYHGAATGPVKISYSQARAKTAECGDWSRDLTETRLNELASNHGCAVQTNIAAMVADPYDFEAPSPVDAATAASRVSGIHAVDGTTPAGTANDTNSNPGGGATGAPGGAATGGGSSDSL
jgi:pilus assembly protein CpaD